LVFCAAMIAAAGSLRAQEPAVTAGIAEPAAPKSVEAPERGPRLPLDWHSIQPRPQRIDVTSSYRAAHKIVLSTLTLAVIVVLVILLIA
jgi:hypothetical protein